MIPLELRLKNFLSYGDEEVVLDLSPLHTLCLSGENGHGKSALLDAITWALWGETRLGRQNHEQLIRIGADEMSVVFTFAEGAGTYRVKRHRSKRTAGQFWELQQSDNAGGWRPLTGATSSDTGKAIVQLIHMTYDTFLNSAYLRQGRADEFVRQTPNKRKEILAEILELSRYDQLESKARARRTLAADQALDAERALNQIEAELADQPAHQSALIACQERALRLAGEREVGTAKWEKLKELRATLQSQREQARRLESEFHALTEEIQSWQNERAVEEQAIEREKALIKDRERIEADFARLQDARSRSEDLSEKVRAAQRIHRERVEIEAQISAKRYQIERNLADAERAYGEIRRQIDELPLLWDQLEALKKHLADFKTLEQEESSLRARKERLADRFAGLKADKRHCDDTLARAQERFARIGQQEEVCSVCGSPLPPEKIANLLEDCERDIQAIVCEQNKLTQEGREIRQEIAKIDTRLDEIAQALAGTQRLRDDIGRKDQVIQDRQAVALTLPQIEKQVADFRRDLQSENFASDERHRLAQVLKEEERLKSADQEFQEAMRAVKSLADAERQYHALAHAQEKIAAGEKRVARACRTLESLMTRQNEKLAEREALSGIEPKFVETEQVLGALRSHLQELADQASRVDEERGRLQQILDRCNRIRQDKSRLQKERDTARKEEEAYTQLAAAFGKKGVQALIIEQALPELQDQANELLERLTDGDMSISIQTTRAAKSKSVGEPIETLDIHVSDSLGTRPLEIYSGGESFRISFALRIALSRLLTHRAGASLQTLIIDEGFGTQDAKGREKLVDAINAVKEDFAKIIIVTHIDELKDAFPSRIEVVKTPSGSQATVVEGDMIG